ECCLPVGEARPDSACLGEEVLDDPLALGCLYRAVFAFSEVRPGGGSSDVHAEIVCEFLSERFTAFATDVASVEVDRRVSGPLRANFPEISGFEASLGLVVIGGQST